MKRILFALLILSVTGSARVFAQTADETAVTAAVETLRKAMLDGDRKQLDAIAAPELSYGHSSGVVQDKAAFVEQIATGKSDFVTLDLTEQTVKVVGNTAIVRHKFDSKTNDNGVPGTVSLKVLLIFQKQNGVWKLIARQAVKPPVAG